MARLSIRVEIDPQPYSSGDRVVIEREIDASAARIREIGSQLAAESIRRAVDAAWTPEGMASA